MPNILFIDIEATNLDGDFGYTICAAHKPLGKPAQVLTIADYPEHVREPWNDKHLLQDVRDIWAGADIVVTYYGKGFDQPFLNARLLANGLQPLPEVVPHVDLYFIARRVLKIASRSMGNVADLLHLEERKMYVPRDTWVKAQTGHLPSIRALARRCKSDVAVLEGAYLSLRGSVRLHPHIGTDKLGTCRFCGSTRLQRRGFQLTATGKKRRVQCQVCSGWDTRRVLNGTAEE